jgi:hypothetical protein
MNKLVIRNRYVYLFLIQALTVLLLYKFLPGRVPLTQTAFQPDSINSLCMGISRFQSNLDSINLVLDSIAKTFYADGFQLACSPEITPPYRTRLFLSFLIGMFSLLGPWWFVLLPSIIIYFALGFIYWLIINRYHKNLTIKELIWYVPFLSPHIGWFLANVMTEGPLLLFLLLISYITYVNQIQKRSVELILIGVLATLSLFTKQSWPLVALVLASYLIERFKGSKKLNLYVFSVGATFLASIFVKKIGGLLYGNDFGEWNDSAVFVDPAGAIKGVLLGIRYDAIHLLTFWDPFGVVGICGAIWIIGFKIRNWQIRLTLIGAAGWGFATMGSVYLADGSFGQNWRFLVFAIFMAYPLYLIDKNHHSETISGEKSQRRIIG